MSSSSPIQKFYDHMAPSYEAKANNYASRLKSKLINEFATTGSRCVDIGAATGALAKAAAQRTSFVVGLDLSFEMLSIGRARLVAEKINNVLPVQASANNLPLMRSGFDLVYAFSTLVLLPDPSVVYKQIYDLLRPGGYAILDITGSYTLTRIYWDKYYKKHGHTGISHHSLKEIKKLFGDIGFAVTDQYPFGFLDQWKYVPLLRYFRILDRILHFPIAGGDLDSAVSNLMPSLANRWYFVLRKPVELSR